MNIFHKSLMLGIYRYPYSVSLSKILSRHVNPISKIGPARTIVLGAKNLGLSKKSRAILSANKSHRGLLVYKSVFEETQCLSKEKWDEIIQFGLESIPQYDECVTAVIRECKIENNFKLASSLSKYLEDKNWEPTTGFLSLFLDLCCHTDECDEKIILDVYRELDKRLPVKSEHLHAKMIKALCQTNQFHLIFPHLQALKSCSDVPNVIYQHVTIGAFRTGHAEDAWRLMDQALQEICPSNLKRLVSAFVSYCNTIKEDEQEATIVRFLEQLQKWQVYLDTDSLEVLQGLMAQTGWALTPTSVNSHRATCQACGDRMSFTPIPLDTFARLTDTFRDQVVKRGNIFLGSNPREYARFLRFLDEKCPFTHVLDGLNIAFKSVGPANKRAKTAPIKRIMANNLIEVVEQITTQPDTKPLIISRSHLVRFNKPAMEKLSEIAHFYLVENMSFDDCFFVYAALRSGVNTKLITSDLLRNHAFLLQDVELKRIFKLWQQRAQQRILGSFPITVQPPSAFTTTCQPSTLDGRSWHIPYNDGSLEQPYDLPRTWLCAKWRGRARAAGRSQGLSAKERAPAAGKHTSHIKTASVTLSDDEKIESSEKNRKMKTNSPSQPRIFKDGFSVSEANVDFKNKSKSKSTARGNCNSGQSSKHSESSKIALDRLKSLLTK